MNNDQSTFVTIIDKDLLIDNSFESLKSVFVKLVTYNMCWTVDKFYFHNKLVASAVSDI